ncbi:MAG: hypothetical protein R3C14_08505 [Caldilineaceae bacterium]
MAPRKQQRKNNITTDRRVPLLRSANWALLLGGVGGALLGVVQIAALAGGRWWSIGGGMVGALLGLLVGCDLLLPGPPAHDNFTREHGSRVGPFRWGVLMALLMVEGLIVGTYLWGTVILTCQQLVTEPAQPQIDCRRTVTGWFNSRQTGETDYDNVVGAGLDVHNELLLQHGPYMQSQSVPGFGQAALAQVHPWLAIPTPELMLVADGWTIRWGSPICFLLALGAGAWAWVSLRHGFHTLREQFELGEIYWGWQRTTSAQ